MKFSHLALYALALSAVTACGGSPPSTPETTDDAGIATPPASSTHPGPIGTVCTSITETYNICADLSSCPGVVIDPNKFPDCGYSVHGDAIDPECLCYGSMCPMGSPGTCADMQALLNSGITAAIVCEEQASGKCTNEGAQGEPSTCDICKNNCDGNVTCLQNCGC
jgi:hypothetical protein